MTPRAAEVADRLLAILERREAKRLPVRPARIVGRNVDGTAQVQRLDGECIARGGGSGYAGEIVVDLPSLTDRRGTTGVGALGYRGSQATLYVERLDPFELPRGATALPVTVIGKGFTASTVLELGVPGSELVNAGIQVVSATFVDTETIDLVVTIAADAALYDEAPVFFDRSGVPVTSGTTSLRRRKERAYAVVPATDGDYLALIGDGAGSTAAVAYLGGIPQATLATTSAFDATDLPTPPNVSAGRYVLAMSATLDELISWDLVTGDVATYTPPAGWLLYGVAAIDGVVYWVEREETQHGGPVYLYDFRLRTAAGFDLTSPSTVVTHSLSVGGGVEANLATPADGAYLFAPNETAVMVEVAWSDLGGGTNGNVRLRLPLAGSGEEDAEVASSGVSDAAYGVPAPASSFLPNLWDVPTGAVAEVVDDVDAALAVVWPPSGSFAFDTPFNLSLSIDGAQLGLYGVASEQNVLTRAQVSGATLVTRFVVGAHPELGLPTFFYIGD